MILAHLSAQITGESYGIAWWMLTVMEAAFYGVLAWGTIRLIQWSMK